MSSLEPATRERLELETRVLAAALRLSLEYGDTEGSSLAHEQIFRLLKACQEIGESESLALPSSQSDVEMPLVLPSVDKGRRMPDIDWFAPAQEEATSGDNAPEFTSQNAIPVDIAAPDPLAADTGMSAKPAAEPVRSRSLSAELEDSIDSLYDLLGAPHNATSGGIHLRFLFKVRRIMRYIQAHPELRGVERKTVLKRLQSYWIAHDILSDSQTRASYDERISGSSDEDDDTDDTVSSTVTSRPPMRIGELLQSSGLLEKTELEIAADMHKAMPELMFGAFLVKQGFVKEDDLECVLIGQTLIKSGELDLGQFQKVMETRALDTTIKLSQLLVESGLVTPQRIAEVLITLPVEEVGLSDLAPKKEAVHVPAPPKDPVSINLKNAIPSWKDQLDWNAPEDEISEPAPQPAPALLPAVAGNDSAVQADGAGQAMTSEIGTQTGEVSAVGTQTGEVNALVQPVVTSGAAAPQDKQSLYDTAQLTPISEDEPETELEPYNAAQYEITSENPVITDEEVIEEKAEPQEIEVFDATDSTVSDIAPGALASVPVLPIDEEPEEPRKARKHSLLDLMVDLVTPELKEEEAEPGTEPLLSTVLGDKESADLDTVLFGPAESPPVSDVGVPTDQNEVLSDDFEMLRDAVDISSVMPSHRDSESATTGPQPVLSAQAEVQPPQAAPGTLPSAPTSRQAKVETAEDVFFGEEDDVNDVVHLDLAVDEILDLPDPGDVAASEAAALAAAAKDTKIDSWSIVSMPASYLASYLLDEEEPAANNTKGTADGAASGTANSGKKHLEPPEDRERGKFRRRRGR